jgi:hypothetical protein
MTELVFFLNILRFDFSYLSTRRSTSDAMLAGGFSYPAGLYNPDLQLERNNHPHVMMGVGLDRNSRLFSSFFLFLV